MINLEYTIPNNYEVEKNNNNENHYYLIFI